MAYPRPFATGDTLLLLSTKRGLIIFSSRDRKTWTATRTALDGHRVYSAMLDQRHASPRLYATDNGDFFGTFLRYSDDFGETWHDPRQGIEFAAESGRKLVNLWTIEPGRASEPDTLYVGVDPASLWTSADRGATWELNQGLEQHPTRPQWNPGNGGLCLHTIIADPSDQQRMWVGISAVGCMRSDDGGRTWQHLNKNVRNDYTPERYPVFGQCIHRLVQHPSQPNTLYQQNHCGIYKSGDAGEDWVDIQHELPSSFGFPMVVDPHNGENVFVIVENGARNNVTDQFTVYRTCDGGAHWEECANGLPGGTHVRLGVLRHGMCTDEHDPSGVYVGTNTGQLFASLDGGDRWHLIADFLPAINAVRAVTLA